MVAWAQPLPAAQPLKDENLLVTLPTGYNADFQTRQPHMLMTEMVPEGQSVKDWTEMLTTQVFFGMRGLTPEQMRARMTERWLGSCKDARSAPVASGEENGYPFVLWLLTCPLNPASGKPEFTWVKAIRGNDSLYVVQKAFKFEPSKEPVTEWMQYLRRVVVCDTRLAERARPAAQK